MIRLIIVDDHPAYAEGLTALIQDLPDITVVGTAHDAVSARILIQRTSPDVVLCDVRLGSVSGGFDVLAEHSGSTFVVMISGYMQPRYVVTAVSRGARGYLSKTAPLEEIIAAVRTVFAGGDAFPDAARRAIRMSLEPPTLQEQEVLLLVAHGLSYLEIASRLSLSVRTVESRLRRMFTRYRVTNRVALVRLARRQGWIDDIR